jgi:hypothetical protein
MVDKFVDTHPQFTIVKNGSFAPNADGEIEFFTVGNTGDSNRKNTFSDPDLTIPNPNPVPLDGNGRSVNPIFLDGSYNTVIRDSAGVQQDEVDNVSGSSGGGVPDIVVDVATDLREVDSNSFKTAYVMGDSAINDGGDGQFYFDVNSTQSDNGTNVIEPTVGGGRYLRLNQTNNGITSLDATGTVDAFVISPTPTVTANNVTRLYIVRSLGPNTVTSTATFRVGTATALNLRRHDTGNLLIGDTGPAGRKMLIQVRSNGAAALLINPWMVDVNAQIDTIPGSKITPSTIALLVQVKSLLERLVSLR